MADFFRLYMDEDSQRSSLARALRSRQVDLLTCNESDLAGVSDETQLQYATAQGRVIFTFNRGDFVRLHKEFVSSGRSHAGIIVSEQLPTGTLLRQLLKLRSARSANEMRSWLEFLGNW